MRCFKIFSFLILFFAFYNDPAQGQIQKIDAELKQLALVKDKTLLVESLNRLSTLYRTRNADSCLHYALEAKRIASNIAYSDGQINADLLIAHSFFKRGVYAESLEILGNILPYYQKSGNKEKIIQVYLDMVEVLNKGISDRPKIISLMQKAMHIGEKLEKDSIMSQLYLSYCNRNPNLSQDSINYYLNKSNEIAHRYKDEHMLVFNRLWKVRLLILDGQLKTAFPQIEQLIKDANDWEIQG